MRPIRVLIVDDAVVVRRMVADVLAADPAIEVAGAVAGGPGALRGITQAAPDVVTLDAEPLALDGFELLCEIRSAYPKLPVIVFFSPLTGRGAAATLDALLRGASDCVAKPVDAGSVGAAQQRLREDLIPKIKSLGAAALAPVPALTNPAPVVNPLTAVAPGTPVPVAHAVTPASPVEAIAIGVATGGPRALADLIPALPGDLSVPVLVAQHMPPLHTRLLAERLNAHSPLPVVEARADLEVEPGRVYLAPGDFHMTVRRQGTKVVIGLNQERAENARRPSVDVLFRAMSRAYGAGTLGVVLTGIGQDGLRGAEHIVSHGGRVVAQDEATSVVWGMAGLVARAGLADRVLPLTSMADEIARRVQLDRTGGYHPVCATVW